MIRSATSLGLAGGLIAVAGWVGVSPSSAAAGSPYDAVARTDVATVTIANASIPAGGGIEVGGPVAKVHQDSLGVRDASAQLPYAGDTVPGLPGLGASLFGFTAPPYPFSVSSTAGTPPSTVAYPGVALAAESADFSTRATSIAGAPGAGASAAARIVEGRLGDVTAIATTSVDTIALGPYGTLSNVATVATVVADAATGELTRSTSSSIGRISVPGLRFTVPEQSPGAVPVPVPIPGVPNPDPVPAPPFPFPGAGTTFADPDLAVQDGFFTVTVPGEDEPQRYTVPTQPVLDALRASGVTMRFQSPQRTETGVIAGSYIVEYTIPEPPPNSSYNGPSTITQTTAYGLAGVTLTPIRPAGAAGPPDRESTAGAAPSLATGVGGAAPALVSADPALGAVPAAPGPGLPRIDLVPAPVPVPEQVQLAAGFRVGEGVDGLYLALVGLAMAGAVGAAAVTVLGVRAR